ncbi:MAG: hypothetical protein ACTS27_04795 [Phycisphaerales bacterium]
MSQFGMQMPGARAKRAASINVYTGLFFVATVALLAACAMAYLNGAKIAPDGQPWKIHDDSRITLPSN